MWPIIFTILAIMLFLGGLVVLFKWHNWGPALIMILIAVILGAGVGIHHHLDQPAQKPKTERVAKNANHKANKAQKGADAVGRKASHASKQKAKSNHKKSKKSAGILKHAMHHPSEFIVMAMLVVIVLGALCSTSN